jgi:hypothetical protein
MVTYICAPVVSQMTLLAASRAYEGGPAEAPHLGRILVALDGSTFAEQMLPNRPPDRPAIRQRAHAHQHVRHSRNRTLPFRPRCSAIDGLSGVYLPDQSGVVSRFKT